MRHLPMRTALKVIYWNAIVALLLFGLGWTAMMRRIHRYDALIVEAAREYGVDPRLVSAVIWRESRYDASQVGAAGEVGLMQVTGPAGREWAEAQRIEPPGKTGLFDVRTNLRAGTWYLARGLSYWAARDDPLPFALAEYNAGRSNALRWAEKAPDAAAFREAITYPTTGRYIRDILRRYRGDR